MTAIATREHQWVKFKITPVSVLPDGQGDPVVFVDPDKDAAADEVTQYGCFACLAPLEKESMDVECPGESEDRFDD